MSYMLTQIRLYGVVLSYDDAKRVLDVVGDQGFHAELEHDFELVRLEYVVDPYEMRIYYDELKMGDLPNYPYRNFTSLGDLFDYFGFPQYQVAPCDRQSIPTAFDERRGIHFHRLRYYADLFCHDSDSRGDSMRLMPGRESTYGIYIASDGYAYRDDLHAFETNPLIGANYERYCRPVLESLGIYKEPSTMDVWQTW